MNVVNFNMKDFTYSKERKSLSAEASSLDLPVGRFPIKFSISSPTGRVVEFMPVPYGHPLYDEDGWDGEMMMYVPVVQVPKLVNVVIFND